MYDVFISYSREDKEAVEFLCQTLAKEKIIYWIDRKEIPLSAEFPAEITHAIENSKIMVFVSSVHSKESDYVTREIKFALDHKVLVMPIKLDDENYNDNIRLFLDIYNHYPAFPPPISQYIDEFIIKLKNVLEVENPGKPVFKRITDENDPDLLVLLKIYRSCFPAEKNVSEEFILLNLYYDSDNHKPYLFILKTVNKIVGIVDCSYFCEQKRLFVSYIGVYHYRSVGDQIIYTHNIVEGLIKYFAENNIVVEDIIFETQEERIFRYFHRILKSRFHLNAYKLCFDYIQPRMMADNTCGVTNEIPAILVYVPVNNQKTLRSMNKKQVLKIIDFLHKNIYFDLTETSVEEHADYLNKLYQNYEKKLSDEIELSLNM